MEDLPLIPGYAFHDPTIRDFKLKQKFVYTNGFRVNRDSDIGIGRRPVDAVSSACITATDPGPVEYDPSLTYGRIREYEYNKVVPDFAHFAQKCLTFKAFFRQGVFNSPDEHYRIRYVNIIYFLEDNTMSVMEPTVDNAGFQQGKLVKRGKICKDRDGRIYHWKDLNVGIDIGIYGVVYHIVDCDLFTREFLISQGVDVGETESAPVDPYTQRLSERDNNEKFVEVGKTRNRMDDARRRFLEYNGMVLTFDAVWNDDLYQIMYFLTDDTIAVREIHKPNDGKEPIAMLLKRTRVPKNWKNLPSTYPAVYLECNDPEVVEFYTPKDFKVGEQISIFGREFHLQDCDAFTRKYYSGMLGWSQPPGSGSIKKSACESQEEQQLPHPPHIKFGSPEDTLGSCLSVVPKEPRKDVVRQLYNFPKKLRYLATMEAVHPEDEDRDFILEYALSDGKITISELEKRNSGRRGGCFLSSMLIPKPSTGRDNPNYYTPEDFFIGAKINVFNHRFIITGLDLYVYRYVEANSDKFCRELRDNLRNYFARQGMLDDDIDRRALNHEGTIRCQTLSEAVPPAEEINPASDAAEETVRLCQAELERQDTVSRSRAGEESVIPDNRNRQDLNAGDSNSPNAFADANNTSQTSEKKRLAWSDQIKKDASGHPIVSCKSVTPQCSESL